MLRHRLLSIGCALATVLLAAGAAQAAITIETVPVGNPGNVADTRYAQRTPGLGVVAYSYSIGTYEVTAGQYTAFLNAVAKTDSYGLYNTNMWSGTYGCKIQQFGSSGTYSYSVASDYANRPVNYVSWGDAARFANWLTNGQGAATSEAGSYTLNGAVSNAALISVTRSANARYVIPTENEWYKAAYYDGSSGVYYSYPIGPNSISTAMANYGMSVGHTTDVGSYAYTSPYGTFDQGGNVWEWNEAIIGSYRCLRGGAFGVDDGNLLAGSRSDGSWSYPTSEFDSVGFRVAEVPEPGTMAVLALGGVGLMMRRRAARRS